MEEKQYTSKQLNILTSVIVIAIAFLETSGAVWSWEFWRQFLYNIFAYIIIAVIVIEFLGNFLKRK